MDVIAGLAIIGTASLFVWGVCALIEQHLHDDKLGEPTSFDQYPLPDHLDDEAAREARQLLGIKD